MYFQCSDEATTGFLYSFSLRLHFPASPSRTCAVSAPCAPLKRAALLIDGAVYIVAMAELVQASQSRSSLQSPAGGQSATTTAAAGSSSGSSDPARPGLSQQQRASQRKAQVRALPRAKKLEKLGVFSACKVNRELEPPPPLHRAPSFIYMTGLPVHRTQVVSSPYTALHSMAVPLYDSIIYSLSSQSWPACS